jgi:hypothetical protein
LRRQILIKIKNMKLICRYNFAKAQNPRTGEKLKLVCWDGNREMLPQRKNTKLKIMSNLN